MEVAHKEIKEHVLRNVDILLNPSDFNPAELTQDSSGDTKPIKIDTGDVEVSVTILPDTDVTTDKYKDIPTGREIDYIRVISEAKYKANPVYKKKIDVYFDKVGVYNVYFDRIFNSSFTTMDKDDEGYTESEKNRNSFYLTNRDISLAGNMYLNGRNVIFKPNLSKFEYYQGNTYIKTNELRTLREIRKGYHMNSKSVFFKDVDKVEPNDLEGWNDTKLLYLDTLGVIDKEDGNEKANVMQKFKWWWRCGLWLYRANGDGKYSYL